MTAHRWRSVVACGALMLPALSLDARADAIDGDWCFAVLTLNIQGSRLRTPAGHEVTGDYSRHAFKYIAPAHEPDTGTAITMQLLSEETMTVQRDTTASPEVWKRCKPIS